VSELAMNLFLALVWMLVQASFSPSSLAVGLLLGFVAIAFVRFLQRRGDVQSALGVVHLAGVFLADLVLASLTLTRDILRRVPPFQPAFLRFDTADLTPSEMVLLANMISLTPGTLTVDADEDGHAIYVHALYARDPRAVLRKIGRTAEMIRRIGGRPSGPRRSA
jgi:multicomponent Na+:H+ antiporter subunit E